MHTNLLAGSMACTLLSLGMLALSACSSEQHPALPQRSEVPSAVQPAVPLQLSGGLAMKAFFDPVTGELRDPSQVEQAARESVSPRFSAPSEVRGGVAARDLATAPSACDDVRRRGVTADCLEGSRPRR